MKATLIQKLNPVILYYINRLIYDHQVNTHTYMVATCKSYIYHLDHEFLFLITRRNSVRTINHKIILCLGTNKPRTLEMSCTQTLNQSRFEPQPSKNILTYQLAVELTEGTSTMNLINHNHTSNIVILLNPSHSHMG